MATKNDLQVQLERLTAELKAAKAAQPKQEPAEEATSTEIKQVRLADQRITVLVAENPKRPGSKARKTFDLYAQVKTTHEFLKAGGFGAALIWDVKHGYIKLGDN